MNALEIAWAGGLFEGEGSIGIFRDKKGNTQTPILQLTMTDEDTVRRMPVVMGMGKVHGPYIRGVNRKPSWTWVLTSFEKVQAAIAMFWPWMGSRRHKRAVEVLKESAAYPGPGHLRDCCKHGHPLSGENLYMNCRGVRCCKTCIKARRRQYDIAHREHLNNRQREYRKRKQVLQGE